MPSLLSVVSLRSSVSHTSAHVQVLDQLGKVLSEIADAPGASAGDAAALALLRALEYTDNKGSAVNVLTTQVPLRAASRARNNPKGGGLVEARRMYINQEFLFAWQLMQASITRVRRTSSSLLDYIRLLRSGRGGLCLHVPCE